VLLKKEFFNTQIIRALPPLLFDNNKALTNIHESLMAQNRHGDIEKMDCALALVGKQILLFFLVLC
jgi:hypothetical protein